MAINLKNIRRTHGLERKPMIVVHGTSGVGKTTFASNANKPIFIQTEAGQGLLELDTFDLATSFDHVTESLDALLTQDHDYKTLVIDSIDHLEPLIWAKLCKENNWQSIADAKWGEGYTRAADLFRELMRTLESLRLEHDLTIILIAHSHIRKFEDPVDGAFDRYEMKLHAKASAIIAETCDCIFFAKHKINIRREDKGFGQQRTKGISTGERVLMTVETPHAVAKNRYNLPDEIPLDWAAFTGELTKSLQPTTEEKTANG